MGHRLTDMTASLDADQVIELLAGAADPQFRQDMVARYGIHSPQAFGVRMKHVREIAKRAGTSHELAQQLWATGWYEARLVASMVDDPDQVTPQQMDRWCADFDSWAIVDTVCFTLFDRTPHAWSRIDAWATSDAEMVRRASYALLWSLANHDRTSPDELFAARLPLLEAGASDERRLVHKAVTMALRAIAKRRPALVLDVAAVAKRLSASTGAARRVGRAVQRELARESTPSARPTEQGRNQS